MEVRKESSKIVKPIYEDTPPPTTKYIPLSVFDKVTFDTHVGVLYAYHPPTPPNATLELGLQKALSVYRVLAGRFGKNHKGNPVILLNDQGVRFVEAYVDGTFDRDFLLKPSPTLLNLHPSVHVHDGVAELAQVQVTRFTCGSMVVGFTSHHRVTDADSASNFLAAWGQACRGVEISPVPFLDRTIFSPRNPPRLEFKHRGVEFISKNHLKKKDEPYPAFADRNIEVHKVHFTLEFIAVLKAKVSSMNGATGNCKKPKHYSTFESLVAHLWRTITIARSLGASETTQLRIPVNGRTRLRQEPSVPKHYFGNIVLWAFPTAKVKELLQEPLPHAAKLIHEAITKVNDNYFKSFVDFASCYKVEEDDLITIADADVYALSPNIDVYSWVRFSFHGVDFGGGRPDVFMPSYCPEEGLIFLLPSFQGDDGSIDAFVSLFPHNMASFKQICYSLG